MTDINNGGSAAPDNSGGTNQDEGRDSVAYETYRKTVGEVKNLKAKLSEMQAKEAEREAQSLAEQGKWKEAAENAQKRAKELEAALGESKKSFGRKLFISELKETAKKHGVLDEVMDDLPKLGDWSAVQIDDEFNVDKKTLEESLLNLIKQKPFVARKPANSPKDVNTGASGASFSGTKPLNQLSKEEAIALLEKL